MTYHFDEGHCRDLHLLEVVGTTKDKIKEHEMSKMMKGGKRSERRRTS